MAVDSTSPSRPVRSVCPYCGVGCGLQMLPPAAEDDNGETPLPWGTRGDRQHPSSLGQVCIK
ncbi:MAG: hypothetical protein LW834_18385, partial [Cyanobium sp. 49614_E6]|nr:hypothetical protein [Cyanobium sp. 49614_E6]